MVGRKIAPLAEALGVEKAVGVLAGVGLFSTSFLVVAVFAHPLGVILGVLVGTVLNHSSGFGKYNLLVGLSIHSGDLED